MDAEWIAVLVAGVSLAFSIYKYAQVRELEAERPYLEKKMSLYLESVQVVSRLAIANEPLDGDIDRFWQLYLGELALVEGTSVESEMVKIGDALNNWSSGIEPDLKTMSLSLAHACRRELATEWSTSWLANRKRFYNLTSSKKHANV